MAEQSTPQTFADILTSDRDSRLMTHAGGEVLEYGDLIDLPTPAATSTFSPISHYNFTSLIRDTAAKVLEPQGYEFSDLKLSTDRDHMRLFGVFTFTKHTYKDTKLAIGFRQALDKSMAAACALGGAVTVCDNLMFSGQEVIFRKHVGDVFLALKEKIIMTLFDVDGVWSGIQEDKEKMTSQRFDDDIAYAHFGRAYGHGLLNGTQLKTCIEEWDKPSFDHGPPTLWKWYNSVTQVYKGLPIHTTMKKHKALHDFTCTNSPFTYGSHDPIKIG